MTKEADDGGGGVQKGYRPAEGFQPDSNNRGYTPLSGENPGNPPPGGTAVVRPTATSPVTPIATPSAGGTAPAASTSTTPAGTGGAGSTTEN